MPYPIGPERVDQPADRQPRRATAAEGGTEITMYSPAGNMTVMRQVGWRGGGGALYELGEPLAQYEHGGYWPLYFPAHSDPIVARPPDPRMIGHHITAHCIALENAAAVRQLTHEEYELLTALMTAGRLLNAGVTVTARVTAARTADESLLSAVRNAGARRP